ncbi:MAG: SseB family protein [Paracoccus hibiscisoli]|uniref:SseB family protein n=1 Tax=Paracoccus hibiscisoli TaxID=2023261 RepID=UPI00391CED97
MSALDDLAPVPFHDADDRQRARMLSRLADTELSVALLREPTHDQVELQIFDLDGVRMALACDAEDRLADFFGHSVAYAALPGRVLAGLLKADGAGLLVNPGHPSEMMLDAAMLDWLTGALEAAPEEAEARLRLTAPDAGVAADLSDALAERLADLRGLVAGAALVGFAGGGNLGAGHLLVIAGAPVDRQPAIAKALAEALAFLPPQPGGVDISFSDSPPPPGALLFDLTPPAPEVEAPRPKGPPILR